MNHGFGELVFWGVVFSVIAWFAWLDDSTLRYKIQYDIDATDVAVDDVRRCRGNVPSKVL